MPGRPSAPQTAGLGARFGSSAPPMLSMPIESRSSESVRGVDFGIYAASSFLK